MNSHTGSGAPTSASASSPDLLWTIMIYLSGDNNLSAMMVQAMDALSKFDLPMNKIAITTYYAPSSPLFAPSYYKLPPTISEEASPHLPVLERARIAEPPAGRNPGAKATLTSFIEWSINTYKSTYRMLVLSGHGSGAVGDFLPASQSPEALTVVALGEALKDAADKTVGAYEGPLLNILGMDSCLMGMAEVCYEVRDYAQYLLASEGFVPNFGWPYEEMLKYFSYDAMRQLLRMNIQPGAQHVTPTAPSAEELKLLEPEPISHFIVDRYANYYISQVPAGVSVDYASCELARLDELQASLSRLTKCLCDEMDPAANKTRSEVVTDLIVLAHWRAQSFNFEQYTDLWDFCDQLRTACKRQAKMMGNETMFAEIVKGCDAVVESVESLVGGRQEHVGLDFQNTHGLSIYFPWSTPGDDVLANYEQLWVHKRAGWTRFLRRYVDATRRDYRNDTGALGVVLQPKSEHHVKGLTQQSVQGAGPNRNSPGYNRFLLLLGPGITGNMKNPPNSFFLQNEDPLGAGFLKKVAVGT